MERSNIYLIFEFTVIGNDRRVKQTIPFEIEIKGKKFVL